MIDKDDKAFIILQAVIFGIVWTALLLMFIADKIL